MTSSRFTKTIVTGITALSLLAGTGVAAAADNDNNENDKGKATEAVVTLEGNGSSGFDFNSSGTGPKGKAHNAKVDSSKNGFTSSTGDKAKADASTPKKKSDTNGDNSSETSPGQVVMIVAGVLAIFAAGYAIATQQALLPR